MGVLQTPESAWGQHTTQDNKEFRQCLPEAAFLPLIGTFEGRLERSLSTALRRRLPMFREHGCEDVRDLGGLEAAVFEISFRNTPGLSPGNQKRSQALPERLVI